MKGMFAGCGVVLVGLFIYLLDDLNLFLSGDEKETTVAQQSPVLQEPHLTPAEVQAQKPAEFSQSTIHPLTKEKNAKEITAEIGADVANKMIVSNENQPHQEPSQTNSTPIASKPENTSQQTVTASNENTQKESVKESAIKESAAKETAIKVAAPQEKPSNSVASNVSTSKAIIPTEKEQLDISDTAEDPEVASPQSAAPKSKIIKIQTAKKDKNAVKQAVKTAPAAASKPVAVVKTNAGYALQLIGAGDKSKVQSFVRDRKLNGKAVIAQTKRGSQDWYVVLYGNYQNREEALLNVKKLPSSVRDIQPWPRKLADAGTVIIR
jgi:septal ring-binding cell division protein DamX